MKYREMIHRMQDYGGFNDEEAKDALQLLVETLGVHLTEGERKDFASQLPEELKVIALSVLATETNSKEDILKQFMELQNIDESTAKKQMRAAWATIKDAISPGEIDDTKAQLEPKYITALQS